MSNLPKIENKRIFDFGQDALSELLKFDFLLSSRKSLSEFDENDRVNVLQSMI